MKIDEKGLLRWAKRGDLVDTTAGLWQDSGDGSGVLPFSTETERSHVVHRTSFETTISQGKEVENTTHYVDASRSKNPVKRAARNYLTTQGWLERLLRRTLRRNTWIYVVVSTIFAYIQADEHARGKPLGQTM